MTGKKLNSGGDYWPWQKGHFDPSACKVFGFEGFPSASPGWYAWLNTQPPKLKELHVVGDVLVSNPGATATLTMREPQGGDPKVLILDLTIMQQPGVWPPMMANIQVRFDRVAPSAAPKYGSIEVYLGQTKIVTIDHIDEVS